MALDLIEHEIILPAALPEVWLALTEARHFQNWFAFGGAEIDAHSGGVMVMRWEEHGTYHARVETVDPPTRFSYRYAVFPDQQPATGNSTLVEFTLSPHGAETRLVVVESGFLSLDLLDANVRVQYAADSKEGWTGRLGGLRDYLAHLRTHH